jgi:hypothetical protein
MNEAFSKFRDIKITRQRALIGGLFAIGFFIWYAPLLPLNPSLIHICRVLAAVLFGWSPDM